MTVLSRKILKSFFSKGRRPTEEHFKSLIDSFVHKQEDELPEASAANAPRGYMAVLPNNGKAKPHKRDHEEVASGLQWHSFTVGYSDLKDDSPEKTIALGDLPAKSLILGTIIKHNTSFAGDKLDGYTLSLGTKSKKDLYAEPYDVSQNPGGTRAGEKQLFAMTNFDRKSKVYLTARSSGGNLDKATEGEAEVYFLTTTPA